MANLTHMLGLGKLNQSSPILSDDTSDLWVTAGELSAMVEDWQKRLAGPRKLVFHYIHNKVEDVALFLGAVLAGHVVALLDPKLSKHTKADLVRCYRPGIILDDGKCILKDSHCNIHPDLAILLSTSGSTGSPKFVRLSAKNLISNASAIAQVLDIRVPEVGCGHLPLHYSYGLSVLTSHLYVGAPVHLTEKGFLDSHFWPQMKRWGITHLPGVPFHYTILNRYGFAKLDLPMLRVMTQAGGGLDVRIREIAHDYMEQRGGRFHIMYGQTEASPRITTLAHTDFVRHPETVGTALPGGRIEIICEDDAFNIKGEVVYFGPNVMMGYAESLKDLLLGDEMKGRLNTGDMGRLDEEGRLTITGRAKRMGKISGLRVNLDEVERALTSLGEEFAVVQKGEWLQLCHLSSGDADALKERALELLMNRFTLPKVTYRFKEMVTFPRTSRNKIDYQALD